MTELMDFNAAGQYIIFRTPGGDEYLDTRDRTMVRLGKQQFDGIAVNWPALTTDGIQARIAGGGLEYRYRFVSERRTYQAIIGSFTGPTPNFILATIRTTRTSGGNIFGFVRVRDDMPQGVWLPANFGDFLLEYGDDTNGGDNVFFNRTVRVGISGSNFVFEMLQDGSNYNTSYGSLPPSIDGNSATEWTFDVILEWGTFDL